MVCRNADCQHVYPSLHQNMLAHCITVLSFSFVRFPHDSNRCIPSCKKPPQLSKAQSDRLKPPLKAHNTSSLKPPYWIGHHPSTTADQKGWCSHTFRWVDGLGVTPKQSRAAGARIRLCSCVGSRMICDTDMFLFYFSLLHPVFQNISVKGTKQKAWDLWWQFWSLHTRPHFKILLFYFSPQWMISE